MTEVVLSPIHRIREILRNGFRLFLSDDPEGFKPSRLAVLFVLSFLLRLPLLIWPEVIYNDSALYIKAAKGVLEGRWSDTIVPPLYPLLIAAANSLTGDFELAGILVSVVFGSLLVIPVFYLGRELYGDRVGIIAALLAMVQPFLYKYSGSVLTESIYYFIVATSALAAVKAHTTGKPLWIVLLGFITAMGYLARPEALSFLIVFVPWVLFVRPPTFRRSFVRRVAVVLLVCLSFLVFSFPYLVVLRKELGRWELSKKAYFSIESKGAGAKEAAPVTPPKRKVWKAREISLVDLARNPLPLVKSSTVGIFKSFYKLQVSLNPLFLLLAIWGFTRSKADVYPWRQNFVLLCFILFFFAFAFGYWKTSARYTSHMIPVILPWVACGLIDVTDRLSRLRQPGRCPTKAFALIMVVIMAGLLTQGIIQRDRGHRVLQREAGRWLKENAPRGEKLASSRVQEAFYADMELVPYHEEDSIEVAVNTARARSARYLVIDDRMEKATPDFRRRVQQDGLRLLRNWEDKEDRIWLFELQSRSDAGSAAGGRTLAPATSY